MHQNYPQADKFYNYIWKNSGVPTGNIKGNGATTVSYTANGEASDYFLGVEGIFALSPEMGT